MRLCNARRWQCICLARGGSVKMKFVLVALVSLAFSLLLIPFSSTRVARSPSAATQPVAAVESYDKLPMSFEANRGQTDGQVKFLSRGRGYTLFLTPSETVLALSAPKQPERNEKQPDSTHTTADSVVRLKPVGANLNTERKSTTVRMRLEGANADPQVSGEEELPGKSNYFIGNDPAKWRTNVPTYAKVRYSQVYSGIDLIYYGNGRQLEYDFVVAPGSDPGSIRLAFEGTQRAAIDRNGELVLKTGIGEEELRLRKPVVYQLVNENRREVSTE